jgi:hypothetical protein
MKLLFKTNQTATQCDNEPLTEYGPYLKRGAGSCCAKEGWRRRRLLRQGGVEAPSAAAPRREMGPTTAAVPGRGVGVRPPDATPGKEVGATSSNATPRPLLLPAASPLQQPRSPPSLAGMPPMPLPLQSRSVSSYSSRVE